MSQECSIGRHLDEGYHPETGQVGFSTQMSGYPTNQDFKKPYSFS